MGLTESTMLALGTVAPDFALTDAVSGKLVRRDDFAGERALLVLFLCTHCPFVKHIEHKLAELAGEYKERGVATVAVCSNDAAHYPEDGPAGMKAQALAMSFSFPYLHDATQVVARDYHAACTPDLFLFDQNRQLVYRGQFDSSRPGNATAVTGEDLRAALEAVLADKIVSADQRPSIGCNIKWKG